MYLSRFAVLPLTSVLYCIPLKSEQPLLVLPFQENTKQRCSQGPGKGTHSTQNSATRNDFDFAISTDVTAVASGRAYAHPARRIINDQGVEIEFNDKVKRCSGGANNYKTCTAIRGTAAEKGQCPDGTCLSPGFGKHVSVDHGNGLFTLYAHLKSFFITGDVGGQQVSVGDKVGVAGSTGFAFGTHLHFGLHQGDASKDANASTSVLIENILIKDRGTSAEPLNGPPVIVRGEAGNFVCGALEIGHEYESVLANHRPTGSLDGVNAASQIFGWAKDADNAGVPVDVHLYVDKNAGTPGAVATLIKANEFRTDVGNHAFNWNIPANLRDGQTHQVWAWGIDLTDPMNNNALLPGSPKSFNIPPIIVNQPPVITSMPSLTATVGQLYTYQVIANDPEGEALTYSLANSLPTGMTISSTGLVQWTPGVNQVGSSAVTVRVTDSSGLSAVQSFTVGVTTGSSGQWSLRHVGVPPIGRNFDFGISYDDNRAEVVLFGGRTLSNTNSLAFKDTWVWRGNMWMESVTSVDPGFGAQSYMVFDAARNETILLRETNDEMWIWNGSQWSRRFPAQMPPIRGSMVYDHQRREVVMTGIGFVFGEGVIRQTWIWDGVTWVRRLPNIHPPIESRGGAFAYDEVRGEVVLFVGNIDVGISLNETWIWNGSQWSRRMVSHSPPPARLGAMAFDGQKVILLIASSMNPPAMGVQTWSWNGTEWKQEMTEASPIRSHTPRIVFDRARGEVVYYTGLCCYATAEMTPGVVWVWRRQ